MTLAIEGYACLFGTEDLGGDIIACDARIRIPQPDATPMMMNHNRTIGIWESFRRDDVGLYAYGQINSESAEANAAIRLIESAKLTGLSIGFRTHSSELRQSRHRTLLSIVIWEISVVTFPMHPNARIDAFSHLHPKGKAA